MNRIARYKDPEPTALDRGADVVQRKGFNLAVEACPEQASELRSE